MHITRQAISNKWPIKRKGTKYLVVPSHNIKDGLPLLVIMREILGFVKTKRELKRVLNENKILVNNKKTKDEGRTLLLFDTLSLKDENKFYKLNYSSRGKLNVEEINEKEANYKVSKIINKHILRGNKTQLNMNDGINLISKEKINVGDSVLFNFKEKKIEKVIPVKEKAKVLIIKGKHTGETGEINEIKNGKFYLKSKDKIFEIKSNEFIVLN